MAASVGIRRALSSQVDFSPLGRSWEETLRPREEEGSLGWGQSWEHHAAIQRPGSNVGLVKPQTAAEAQLEAQKVLGDLAAEAPGVRVGSRGGAAAVLGGACRQGSVQTWHGCPPSLSQSKRAGKREGSCLLPARPRAEGLKENPSFRPDTCQEGRLPLCSQLPLPSASTLAALLLGSRGRAARWSRRGHGQVPAGAGKVMSSLRVYRGAWGGGY